MESIPARLAESNAVLNEILRDTAIRLAANNASQLFIKWTNELKPSPTLKAICKKGGVHKSKLKGGESIEYKWNEELAEALLKPLERPLHSMFSQIIPSIRDTVCADVDATLRGFFTSLIDSCMDVTSHIENPLSNLMHTLDGLTPGMQRSIISVFERAFIVRKRMREEVVPKIRQAMEPGYMKASKKSGNHDHLFECNFLINFLAFTDSTCLGSGSFNAAKDVLGKHIEMIGPSMYKSACKDIGTQIQGMTITLENTLKQDSEVFMARFEKGFAKMTCTASTTPRPETGPRKVELQNEVLERLRAFGELLGKDMSQDEKAIPVDDLFEGGNIKRANADNSDGNNTTDEVVDDGYATQVNYQDFSDEEDIDED